ncbi:hypothetical protein SAY87_013256 [Trapa incisa]|uniref:RING-CH-type domain-containing protein n=1 Tax=Trapa incisa TaxID=236973 RepID=A0AAN7QD24_9MYRT|nr:hypothetical protein SAY87_013256 [Trapa incisa]
MEEVALLIDELRSSVLIAHCRICHEEELESSRSLESPCACSGTVKFAHRDCIQRWCDEKGNTTCEICLQVRTTQRKVTISSFSFIFFLELRKAPCFDVLLLFCRIVGFSAKSYEPGYTATSKKPQLLIETAVTIREQEPISSREETVVWDRDSEADHPECASAADRGAAAFCRSFALTLTGFLLLRQVVDLLDGRPGQYPFTPVTVLLLRVCGIIIPMFALTRAVSAVQNRICGRPYHVIA